MQTQTNTQICTCALMHTPKNTSQKYTWKCTHTHLRGSPPHSHRDFSLSHTHKHLQKQMHTLTHFTSVFPLHVLCLQGGRWVKAISSAESLLLSVQAQLQRRITVSNQYCCGWILVWYTENSVYKPSANTKSHQRLPVSSHTALVYPTLYG